ncbi:MAG: hypothetical protein IJ419_01220 [Agathobacter sp.]|nr:hypothetical protein [Agathobacter sp.]
MNLNMNMNLKIPKIKISMRIVAVLIVIATLICFFYVHKNVIPEIEKSTQTLTSVNTELESKLANLQELADNRDMYIEETERLNLECEEILSHFPTFMYLEDKILYVDTLLKTDLSGYGISDVIYGQSAFELSTQYLQVGKTEPTTVELYSVALNGSYTGVTYKQVKELLNYAPTAHQRLIFNTLNVSYNEQDGYLAGQFSMTTYFIPGQPTPYQFPDSIIESLDIDTSNRIDDLFNSNDVPINQGTGATFKDYYDKYYNNEYVGEESEDERSQAMRDEQKAAELVNIIKTAIANQDVYDEIMRYAAMGNVSCYVDSSSETTKANKEITYKGTAGLREDQYTFTDGARQFPGREYYFAGNMRGVTLTLEHNVVNGVSILNLDDAIINKALRGGAVKVTDNRKPDEVAYASGREPRYDKYGTVATMSMDDKTHKLHDYLMNNAVVGVEIESERYRNSDFTIFINTQDPDNIQIYGQWGGQNLR